MTKLIFTAIVVVSLLGLQGVNSTGLTFQSEAAPVISAATYASDLELAERYAPVFYFHPDENYLPQPVDVVIGISRLRHSVRLWFDTTITNKFTAQDLFTLSSDNTWFIDQWFGDTGSSEYANFSAHQVVYDSGISPDTGGSDPRVYAHILRSANPPYITIQYWLFYFYNDWFNKHEGDWELVEVILSTEEQPTWVIYSQHHGGVRRSWDTSPLEDSTHPVVYVARGSHANYFAGNEIFLFPQPIGNRQLVLVDRTGISQRVIPQITLIPTRSELVANPAAWPGAEWLMFRGRWGESAVYSDFNGPYGPADKGAQWDDPYAWGMEQPLDVETWYKNRLRVETTGEKLSSARVQLVDEHGQQLPGLESLGSLALLHTEPPKKVIAQIKGPPGAFGNVLVNWPDQASGTVTRTSYAGLVLDITGNAKLEISSNPAVALSGSDRISLPPTLLGTDKVLWDAPDVVWMGGTLPVQQILAGLLICLLISLVPILFLVAVLVWADRYKRKPVRLLAVAFSWGAIPALLIAFSVQLFFKLPPNLMGPHALEVIRLGLLAPVIEETFKAIGILFIFWRFRRAIGDVLDGMIYGAMVGFGFAFISNLFRYAGDFVSLGFPALNLSFVVERSVHVLNHGLYSGIFGASLGFALLMRGRLRFWATVLLGLVLAIATHALQNLLSNSLVGLNVFTVIVTSAGTLLLWAVAGWSLVQQHRLLRKELQSLVHPTLYKSIQDPLARTRSQWATLRRDGFRTWLKVRRLQGLCIKLAHTRLQARLDPEHSADSGEADALLIEIARIFDSLHPATG